MKPVLSNSEARELDALTIENEPISSIDLMERASKAFCVALLQRYNFHSALIFCGPGNNGGDGLAIARLLAEMGIDISAVVPSSDVQTSQDHSINLERIKLTSIKIYELDATYEINAGELIIDALFGSGLSRPLEGKYLDTVNWINRQNKTVVSVDIPSGMSDQPDNTVVAVKADYTISFQNPYLSMLMPTAMGVCESFDIVDIGLVNYTKECKLFLMEDTDIRKYLPHHSKFTHKYKKGGALLVGGSRGMIGSIILSAEAVLRTGSGLVHAVVDEEVISAGTCRVPEVMFHSNEDLDLVNISDRMTAIGIGPGLGKNQNKLKLLKQALNLKLPKVLDADAIHMVAKEGLSVKGCILTPHEGEFQVLVGSWSSQTEKLEKLIKFAKTNECIVLLKGAHTIVSDGNACYFNPLGDPAMATAGSGDVLLGIITSLLSQGCKLLESALCGTYVHSVASILYLSEKQSKTLISSDMISNIGKAILCLSKAK